MSGVRAYASRHALEQSERLLPGRVLETAVERAIENGQKNARPLPGVPLGPQQRLVFLDDGVAVVVAKKETKTPGGRQLYDVLRILRPKATP